MTMTKIFGVGLPKTGTTSTAEALRILGFNVIHNPVDPVTVSQLMTSDFRLSILEKCDGIMDLPSSLFFEEYDALYPGSKFILTTRDETPWLDSCESWCRRLELDTPDGIRRQNDLTSGSLAFLHGAAFGCVNFHRERFRRTWRRWAERVNTFFRERWQDCRVLHVSWSDEAKWALLCDFLGVPRRTDPFPRLNVRQEHHAGDC
jgi:hypothetical protein